MASWVLACRGCGHVFKHFEIDDKLESRFLTVKPSLPPEGSTSECPNCKGEFSYTKYDLRYQHDGYEAR
jgi:hypothetical protein